MAYIANGTRVVSLTIGGTDYTSDLITWQVSDSSANKNGCIATSGAIVLGMRPGVNNNTIADYDRDNFKRGQAVVLTVTSPSGTPVRHPRGLLYVISTAYDSSSETLSIEIACRLSLIALTEDSSESEIQTLRDLVPMRLDEAQKTYQACCGGLASLGKYVYQNNSGSLVVGEFFDNDSYGSVSAGAWTSIKGVTALSASPLAGTGAVPDSIKLQYQYSTDEDPNQGIDDDDTITESYYFLQYPVVSLRRQNTSATSADVNGKLQTINNTLTQTRNFLQASTCGNLPPPPDNVNVQSSCNDGYETVQSPVYLPAKRVETTRTEYGGPAGQVSYTVQEVRGPRLEANSSYFADSFAYCKSVYADSCNPNGSCPYSGMNQILLSRTETTNYFGEANEVVRTITDNYVTKLSAAQTSDWRAGNSGGTIQDFDSSLGNDTGLFRIQRTDTTYEVASNRNVQTETVYTSSVSRGVGIKGGHNIDALSGIVTKTIRKSATISTLDLQPDTANSPTTVTNDGQKLLPLFTGRYVSTPPEAGPYELEEQIPLPILLPEAEISQAIDAYSRYIVSFVKGDALGLQIGEKLRDDVVSGWYPGMPFRFYDPQKGKLFAMRMDATAWGASGDDTAFVTNGIWLGVSNGTVTLPSNIVGDSTPDMTIGNGGGLGASGGTAGSQSTENAGSVTGETGVDSGALAWNVDVYIATSFDATVFAPDGIQGAPIDPQTANTYRTMTAFVAGLIVSAGDLLSTDGTGSIPLDYNGALVVADATVVTADLFA